MIKKKYLTEVSFKNGVDEFRAYRTFTKTFKVVLDELSTTNYRVDVENTDIEEESIVLEIEGRYEVGLKWRKVNGESSTLLEVYTEGLDNILNGDTITVRYLALNTYASDLYSIDYNTGTLYLANKTNVGLKCSCEFYNIFLTGRVAEQLESENYVVNGSMVNIHNINTEESYVSVYNKLVKSEADYLTPILKDVKVNYITTSEEDSF